MAKVIRALIALTPLLIFFPVHAEEFRLDSDIVELADKYATEDISSELIQAVIWTESRGKADAVSADGYNIGLMQLHVWYFSGDLYDAENNVEQGAKYLQSLYNTYGDIAIALMAYHGEVNVTTKPISYYASSIIALAGELKLQRQEKVIKAAVKRNWHKSARRKGLTHERITI